MVVLMAETSPELEAVSVYCPTESKGTLLKLKLASPAEAATVWLCEKEFGPVMVTVMLALEAITRTELASYTPTLMIPIDEPASTDAGGACT
jgi:hypothetical protein